jgi:hypothetical protein
MDDPELIDKYEDELWQIIFGMHKDGINYSTILFVMEEAIKNLNLMAYCERWLAEYATGKGLVAETI